MTTAEQIDQIKDLWRCCLTMDELMDMLLDAYTDGKDCCIDTLHDDLINSD